jgi:hypothetical protein
MGFFDKGICPICNKETKLTNRSSIKYDDYYVCSECIKKLGANGIMPFSIKKYKIEDLSNIVNEFNSNNNILKNNKINNICPICENQTTFATKSGEKYGETFLCNTCLKKLLNSGIFITKIKEKSLDELRETINNYSQQDNTSIELKNNYVLPKVNKPKNQLKCPNCGGFNLELLSTDNNYKTKYKTTVNLNPLKPFTLVNTKEVKKEKKSIAKIGLAVATAGTSALITGTTKKNHNEYFCKDCGNRWIGK